MDEDDIGKDELAGTITFMTKDLVERGEQSFFMWKNIYGSPMGQKDSAAKNLMNNHPSLATHWKGRVLCKIESYSTLKPIAKLADASKASI